MPIIEDKNPLTIREIRDYLRRDRGHSKRAAKGIANDVLKFEEVSKREMPSGWHDILHPPKVSFVRRMGWSPFEFGGGTQIVRTQENGPEAQSAKIRFEAA